MAYVCDLGAGYQVYLDNQGTQTTVTTSCQSSGQQQQASSSLSTGVWTKLPEAYQTPSGTVLKISTAQGKYFVQVQGNRVSTMAQGPTLDTAQQIQMQQTTSMPGPAMPSMQPMQPMQSPAMQPMEPMQPMTMGNMQMSMNPMEMRMGNMEMRMGSAAANDVSSPGKGQRFCSQCGAGINPSDLFCTSCGHALS